MKLYQKPWPGPGSLDVEEIGMSVDIIVFACRARTEKKRPLRAYCVACLARDASPRIPAAVRCGCGRHLCAECAESCWACARESGSRKEMR